MLFEVYIGCDVYEFIDQMVEHYAQSKEVRALDEKKLLELNEYIDNAPDVSNIVISLAKWDEHEWKDADDDIKCYPLRVSCKCEVRYYGSSHHCTFLKSLPVPIGKQLGVYAVMRWIQVHCALTKMKKDVASTVPSECVDSVMELVEKYKFGHVEDDTHKLFSTLNDTEFDMGFPLSTMMIRLYRFYVIEHMSTFCEARGFVPADIEKKRQIFQKMCPKTCSQYSFRF